MNAMQEMNLHPEEIEKHEVKTREDDFPFSDEVKQDLQDILDGKDLIGPFHSTEELFKSMGI